MEQACDCGTVVGPPYTQGWAVQFGPQGCLYTLRCVQREAILVSDTAAAALRCWLLVQFLWPKSLVSQQQRLLVCTLTTDSVRLMVAVVAGVLLQCLLGSHPCQRSLYLAGLAYALV